MFEHVLVPLDGSELAEMALPAAVSIARRRAGRVTLLHLVESEAPAQVHGQRHLRAEGEATAYLAAIAARWAGGGVPMQLHVDTARSADVAGGIALHVRELNPDIVVLSRHGRAGMRGLLHGSVAQQVVALETVPVLLIRAQPGGLRTPDAEFACRRILIPHDADPAHSPAMAAGLALARLYQSEVRLLSVVPTRGTLAGSQQIAGNLLPGMTAAMLDAEHDEAASHLRVHLQEMGAGAVPVSAAVSRGEPAREIERAAKAFEADVIVLATHGRAGTNAFWHNSTAARVCRRSTAAVLLVPVRAAT